MSISLETICLNDAKDGNGNIRGSGWMAKRGKRGSKGMKR